MGRNKLMFSFVFFKEETLTDPAGSVFIFNWTAAYPIRVVGDDLLYEINTEHETVLEALKSLEEIKVINLDIGWELEALAELLKDQPLYLNATLSNYCSIDLMAFKGKTEVIEISYADLEFLPKSISISNFSDFLPEFILDFGEALEENKVLCWVGDVGILGGNFTNHSYVKLYLEELCSGYIILENLEYVLENFDLNTVENQFKKNLSDEFKDLNFILSYKVEIGNLRGVQRLQSLIRNYRKELIEGLDMDILDLYRKGLFRQKGVGLDVTVNILHASKETTPFEYEGIITQTLLRKDTSLNMLCNRGTRHLANVWWEPHEVHFERFSPGSYGWTLTLYPMFGDFTI